MNLIVTCARHMEQETKGEILGILENFGDSNTDVSISNMSGILTVKTNLEPIQTCRQIKELILDEPWSIRYCMRIIPIQFETNTELKDIEKIIENQSDKILEDETYRISIEKRNSVISSKDIISAIANKIKNKVSLEFPDKTILIEILGKKTGISIIKNSDIVSLEKTKRSISE